MTLLKIITRLEILAEEMELLADVMEYYGGFANWGKHSKKLREAAPIIKEWADEILQESLKNDG